MKAETPQIFRRDTLESKTALVTGGGTGIGRAIALQLGACGARVAIVGRRAEPLKEVQGLLSAAGVTALAMAGDIREEDTVEELVTRVDAELGRVEILVNNAGGQFVGPAREVSTRGLRAVYRLNVEGSWNVTRAVARRSMIDRGGGRIVNITLAMQRGIPGMMAGVSSRAAVHSITRHLGTEWARHGISTVSVAAGHVMTEGLRQYPEDVVDALRDTIPARRFGTPEEVAALVAFLVSPMGGYITGTVVTIDGGKSNHGRTEMVDLGST